MIVIIQIILFLAGAVMLGVSIDEPTYEQLLQPIPFLGMILCLVGILLGMIISVIDEFRED